MKVFGFLECRSLRDCIDFLAGIASVLDVNFIGLSWKSDIGLDKDIKIMAAFLVPRTKS